VSGLACDNLEVVNLSNSGWKVDLDPLCEIAEKLQTYTLNENGVVVINILSNFVKFGGFAELTISGKRPKLMLAYFADAYIVAKT
jgi:hypothetical protein